MLPSTFQHPDFLKDRLSPSSRNWRAGAPTPHDSLSSPFPSPIPLSRIEKRMEVSVMHVVMGASGNTGHIVASNLLTRGEKVRVIGRNSAHLQPLVSKGAEPFIADVSDAGALAKAFHGADSAFVMIPPNMTSKDPLGYANRVS